MCSILTASDLAQCTGGLMFSQIGILLFYFISCSIHYNINIITMMLLVYISQPVLVTSSALSCPFLLNRGGMSLDWTCCWAIWFWFWLRKCWFWTWQESHGRRGSPSHSSLSACLILISTGSRITWLDLTNDFGPMSNCDCGVGAMWPLWPLKSGLVRWRPIVGEYLSWITPGPVPIPLPAKTKRC